MKILLDTCTLLWWWSSPEMLSVQGLAMLKDPRNSIFVSAASAWEIATKHRIGKLSQGAAIINEWSDRLNCDGFIELAICSAHTLRAGSLPGEHRDPFDRMIAAQSILEQNPVLTSDIEIGKLGAKLLW